jgi:RHS repeat-associated protein
VLGDLTYEYDKNGNRIKTGGSFARTGIPQAVSSTAYNAANHQTTFADKTLTYDNNGNLQTITDASGTTTYTWNARNHLVGISGPGVSATFVYDGLGRREKKTINGNLTEFLYDGLNPVQETSGATILANVLPGLAIDEFLTRTDVVAGTTGNFLTDILGSPVAVTDNAGVIQTEYTYEPFGKATFNGASNTNPYQFTARENDSTGLGYYRARYYDAQFLRFVSEDPLRFSGGVNFYTYVGNNPVRYTDPRGLYFPTFHAEISFIAHLLEGDGVGTAIQMGWESMRADRPIEQSPAKSNQHAMAQPGQNPSEARKGWCEFIKSQVASGTAEGRGAAEHAVQDSYAPPHGFDQVWRGFQWTDLLTGRFWSHLWQDLNPSLNINNYFQAIEATRSLIRNNYQFGGRKC